MSKFMFEGRVWFIIKGQPMKHDYYGKIVYYDDGKKRRLELCFDLDIPLERMKLGKLSMELRSLDDQDCWALLEDEDKYYIARVDKENVWRSGDSFNIRLHDTIYSSNSEGQKPEIEEWEISGIKFELQSNANMRGVLRRDATFNLSFGSYKEKGNQYTRSIELSFNKPKSITQCQNLILAIVQARTIIDGFQNYESDVLFLLEKGELTYNYLSRRRIEKCRWYESARFDPIDEVQYAALIEHFYQMSSQQERALLAMCEYLHTSNYSLPTSRYMEIITMFEGFAKKRLFEKSPKDCKWTPLKEEFKKIIDCSDYSVQEQIKMKEKLDGFRPGQPTLNECLTVLIANVLQSLGADYKDQNIESLIRGLVKVRNQLSHDPAKYLDDETSRSKTIVDAVLLIREMCIVVLMTGGKTDNKAIIAELLTNATHLRGDIEGRLEKLQNFPKAQVDPD